VPMMRFLLKVSSGGFFLCSSEYYRWRVWGGEVIRAWMSHGVSSRSYGLATVRP
jgi:hypothetical protein